jgi:hypothetical protein
VTEANKSDLLSQKELRRLRDAGDACGLNSREIEVLASNALLLRRIERARSDALTGRQIREKLESAANLAEDLTALIEERGILEALVPPPSGEQTSLSELHKLQPQYLPDVASLDGRPQIVGAKDPHAELNRIESALARDDLSAPDIERLAKERLQIREFMETAKIDETVVAKLFPGRSYSKSPALTVTEFVEFRSYLQQLPDRLRKAAVRTKNSKRDDATNRQWMLERVDRYLGGHIGGGGEWIALIDVFYELAGCGRGSEAIKKDIGELLEVKRGKTFAERGR